MMIPKALVTQLVKMLPKDAPQNLINGLIDEAQKMLRNTINSVELEPGEFTAVIHYTEVTDPQGNLVTIGWIGTIDENLNPVRQMVRNFNPRAEIEKLDLASKIMDAIK